MKKNQKIFYKVISASNRSSIMFTGKGLEVTYPPKTWVKPVVEGSKLFVAKTRKHAKKHATIDSIIVRCHVKNPSEGGRRLGVFGTRYAETVHFFWKNGNIMGVLSTHAIEEGTVLCDEVYCLE